MRHVLARAVQGWFRWTMPRGLATDSMAARERLRKAHMLSIGVFFALVLSLPWMILNFLTHSFILVVVLCSYTLVHFGVGWLNRQGRIELASWVYVVGYMGTASWGLAIQFPISGIMPLWGWSQMIVPTVFAGLFLPYWTPLLFCLVDCVIVTIIIRAQSVDVVELHDMTTTAQLAYFAYIYIIMGVVAGICAVSAFSVEKAVAEADRSKELAEAHAALEFAHIDLASAYNRLESVATTDAITGLLNHRALDERLVLEVERTRRTGEPFTIIFADLDHFKLVNDTWGHQAGDSVLAHLATQFQKHLRTVDVVARYGGEEFVMLLPGQNHEQGAQSAERLRHVVEESQVILPDDQQLTITISMGVAVYPHDGINGEAVLVAADIAMYRAKHAGRNRVCSTQDAPGGDIDTQHAA